MAKIIELPKLSPTMEEGRLLRWAKNEGDTIEIDELLAEVETDKATMEFRAFDRGTLLKRLVAEGTTAKLGQPVAILGSPGEDFSALLASLGAAPVAKSAAPAKEPEKTAAVLAPAVPVEAPKNAAPPVSSGPAALYVAPSAGLAGLVLLPPPRSKPGTTEPGRSSPRIRRMARELNVELSTVQGTGEEGRITLEDLQRAAKAPKPTAVVVAPAVSARAAERESTVREPSPMRKTIARRLTEAKRDVPHFYLEADLDVAPLLALREQLNEGLEKEQRISVTDLLLRACAVALTEVPEANASWIDGMVHEHHRVDISLAVSVEDGLLTPVLRDVDRKTVKVIAREAKALALRARERKLKPEEMQGGVFSLSNLGMYGIDRFSAVINPPESMILAVGATRQVPVVSGGQIVVGQRCAVTLSCDHRVVDGALGARYLKALRELVEHPLRVLA